MVDNLRTRFLVNQVYASPSSSAGEKLANRDDNGVAPLEGTDGTMQQLIEYLDTSGKEICLVCLGYAGLTTNVDDLRLFLSNHVNIKKILVDRLPYAHEVIILDSNEIVTNDTVARKFNCRTGAEQRSK
jgi:hypothetical protein